eukprot:7214336-Ditylum_brightwellii.AAC.1
MPCDDMMRIFQQKEGHVSSVKDVTSNDIAVNVVSRSFSDLSITSSLSIGSMVQDDASSSNCSVALRPGTKYPDEKSQSKRMKARGSVGDNSVVHMYMKDSGNFGKHTSDQEDEGCD